MKDERVTTAFSCETQTHPNASFGVGVRASALADLRAKGEWPWGRVA
jgi:hypothetical protein